MELATFLNRNFGSTTDLAGVDALLVDLEARRLSTKPNEHLHAESVDNTSRQLYDEVKTIIKAPEEATIKRIEELIGELGPIPLLTFCREVLKQKGQLLDQRNVCLKFQELFSKVEGFREAKVATHKEREHTLKALRELKKDIREFASVHNNFDNVQVLNNQLNAFVETDLVPVYKIELISNVNGWEQSAASSTTYESFGQLLQLQLLTVSEKLTPGTDTTLWVMDCLVEDFRTKFVFHFEGESETNRIDKPEFAMAYLLSYLRKNVELAKSIWKAQFCSSMVPFQNLIVPSFSSWFITSPLNILKRKLLLQMPQTKVNSKLLSHLVTELKKFDVELTTEFSFVPSETEEWKGLTFDLILNNESVWQTWLANEKEFVNIRFEEIIDASDAFTIEHEVIQNGKTKPTKSSVNLKNLIESITDNYSNLPIAFQMKFLSEVQLKLLNFYFTTLKNGLKVLLSIKSTSIENVSTLERICRIYCASQHMVEMMVKWGHSRVFIQLWETINPENGLETTFFGSVINGYQHDIINNIPKLLRKYIDMQLNQSIKGYIQNNRNWAIQTGITTTDFFLNPIIQTLGTDLQFLSTTVSQRTLVEWKLIISKNISQYFENNFILSYSFTKFGAMKLKMDINYIFDKLSLVKEYTTYGRLCQLLDVYEGKPAGEQLNANDLETLLSHRVD